MKQLNMGARLASAALAASLALTSVPAAAPSQATARRRAT